MIKRFWKWLKGNQDDHHWKHIPWSKTPPMPKRVEPGQGVRGETEKALAKANKSESKALKALIKELDRE